MAASDLAEALGRLGEVRDDERAWLVLYRNVRPLVLHAVARQTQGRLDVGEDVLQEVLVRLALYCKFERWKDPVGFRSYVAAISRNICRDQLRAGERRTLAAISEEPEPSSREGEEQAEADDLRRWLRNQLSSRDRELLELVLEGRTISELATSLRIDPNTVRVRIHRLRRRLKTSVDKLWTG